MWVLELVIDCFKKEPCLSVIDRQGFFYLHIATIYFFSVIFCHINQVYTNNLKN